MDPSQPFQTVPLATVNQRTTTDREYIVPTTLSASESSEDARDVVAVARTPRGKVKPYIIAAV